MPDLKRASVEEFRVQEKLPVVVVLDHVRSMHNVGSVFRTADAAPTHESSPNQTFGLGSFPAIAFN